MSRNGLITAIGFVLFLAPSVSLSKPDAYFPKKEFKDFDQAVHLLKDGKDDEAFSMFKKSDDEDFILDDYSLLFMATLQFKLKNYDKALGYLEDAQELNEASTLPYVKRLSGEITLAQKKYEDSFADFLSYFKAKGVNESSSKSFRYFADSFKGSSLDDAREKDFYPIFFQFIRPNADHLRKYDSLSAYDEIASSGGYSYELAQTYESEGDFKEAVKVARDNLLTDDDASRWFSILESLSQKEKDYDQKIRILREKLANARNQGETGEIYFELGMAFLNRNLLKESLDFFWKASKSASKPLLMIKADYYRGRVWEDIGDTAKAMFNYRKARNIKCQTEDEISYVVKALFRAGWLNYRSANYKEAAKDFELIFKKFGLRLTEEGYNFWLGMTYEKLGRKEKAKALFEATYTSFPLSYYGILSGIALKKDFDLEPDIKKFSIKDFVETISPDNEHHIDRAILLYSVGLDDFAREESERIRTNYSNTMEVYLTAILNMLFDNNGKAINLVDYIISQKGGWPDDEILKLYYPVKFMNFISDYSEKSKVDPYLITSIIRQESVFRMGAVSKARAMGLMQIIPSLGFKKAKELELGDISERDLLNPEINIKVGVSHFVGLLTRFKSNIVYAVAAYNSSEKKVDEWIAKSGKIPILEFIEEIPYFETRKYVKLNIRNYLNYLRIYSDKDWRKVDFEQGGF